LKRDDADGCAHWNVGDKMCVVEMVYGSIPASLIGAVIAPGQWWRCCVGGGHGSGAMSARAGGGGAHAGDNQLWGLAGRLRRWGSEGMGARGRPQVMHIGGRPGRHE